MAWLFQLNGFCTSCPEPPELALCDTKSDSNEHLIIPLALDGTQNTAERNPTKSSIRMMTPTVSPITQSFSVFLLLPLLIYAQLFIVQSNIDSFCDSPLPFLVDNCTKRAEALVMPLYTACNASITDYSRYFWRVFHFRSQSPTIPRSVQSTSSFKCPRVQPDISRT